MIASQNLGGLLRASTTLLLVFLAAIGAAGCNRALIQGEPNFNTAILLSGTSDAARNNNAARNSNKLNLKPQELPSECSPLASITPASATVGSIFPATISLGVYRVTVAATSADSTIQVEFAPDGKQFLSIPPMAFSNFEKLVTTQGGTGVKACSYAVKALIDDEYREYRIALHHLATQGNLAADVSVLGLTTAATSPISSLAKTVLSGLGTFIGGAKTDFNEDLLYKQTIEILLEQMDADRDQQFTLMLKQMSGDSYTIPMVKDDLLAYFQAGTWDHAITSLQSKVSSNQADCKSEQDAAKVKAATSASKTGTEGGPTTPTTSKTGSGCVAQPSTVNADKSVLTVAEAKAGNILKAANGVGSYKVVKAAATTDDEITVSYAPNDKDYVPLPPMAFSKFAALVTVPTGSTTAPATPSLSWQEAKIGAVFQAVNGIGNFKVIKAPTSATSDVTVSYAPNGKTYQTLPPMTFEKFATLVKAPST